MIVVVAPVGAPDECVSTNLSFQLKPFGERVRLGEIYKFSVERPELVQQLWSFIVSSCRRHCGVVLLFVVSNCRHRSWLTAFEYCVVLIRVPIRVLNSSEFVYRFEYLIQFEYTSCDSSTDSIRVLDSSDSN